MAINTSQNYNGENTAFAFPDEASLSHSLQKWHGLNDCLEWSRVPYPSLLSQHQHLIEPREQPIGFEDPFGAPTHGDFVREASIPLDQLRNEILWPEQWSSCSKQQRKDSLTTYDMAEMHKSAVKPAINNKPVKRKRGRPRLEPPYSQGQEPIAPARHDLPTRMSQLEKNRIAADKCRRQRKEYTSKLMAQHSRISARNEALKADVTILRDQVLSLKHEVLQHAKCGSRMIERYVTRTAGDICSGDVPLASKLGPRNSVEPPLSPLLPNDTDKKGSDGSSGSQPRQKNGDSCINSGDHDGLWFLDYDRVVEDQQGP